MPWASLYGLYGYRLFFCSGLYTGSSCAMGALQGVLAILLGLWCSILLSFVNVFLGIVSCIRVCSLCFWKDVKPRTQSPEPAAEVYPLPSRG